MLININEDLSVQQHRNLHGTQWICYEPLASTNLKKRRAWKKITGLMSTGEMHCWLSKNYPENENAIVFQKISDRSH